MVRVWLVSVMVMASYLPGAVEAQESTSPTHRRPTPRVPKPGKIWERQSLRITVGNLGFIKGEATEVIEVTWWHSSFPVGGYRLPSGRRKRTSGNPYGDSTVYLQVGYADGSTHFTTARCSSCIA